ncbi:HlyD family efflux transporter periplasmic adaptor subunit [Candidatus Falkowbacteria bacterium]|nr:HlyD family efflux transporter periplasmic adaptor subunit [Candidatus Falkowbacteria bacterium]
MKKILTSILKNKFKIILLILLAGGGWYYFNNKQSTTVQTKYVLGKVERGSVIASVSGTGQVSSQNQVDIKPEISAKITELKIKSGQKVKKGEVLARLDAKTLSNQVRSAKDSLNMAKTNLELKLEGVTAQDVAVAQKSVDAAKLSYQNAQANVITQQKTGAENLKKAQRSRDNSVTALNNSYQNTSSPINSSLITMRSAILAANNIMDTSNLAVKNLYGVLNPPSLEEAKSQQAAARAKLASFESLYASLGSSKDADSIERLLNEEQEVSRVIKSYVHSVYSLMLSTITSADLSQTTLDGYRSSIASQENSLVSVVGSLQSASQSIVNAKQDIATADSNLAQTVSDNQKSLDSANTDVASKKLSYETSKVQYEQKVAKPRPIDLANLRLQIAQAQTNYDSAVDDLKSATITAPFDGVVLQVSQSVGDNASPADIIATVATPKKIAEVTLNEVDTAKVKVGQKSTLTFSAIDGLTITGEVAEIDNIGTVTQGVVSYGVKIAFDTQDDRIKPQMSVSASITTDEKVNVLVVPNSAVKTDSSGAYYVEALSGTFPNADSNGVVSATPPEQKSVVIGIANDTNTEIVSGVNEGDQIVTQTSSGSTTQTTQRSSGLNLFGGGGGAVRGVGR